MHGIIRMLGPSIIRIWGAVVTDTRPTGAGRTGTDVGAGLGPRRGGSPSSTGWACQVQAALKVELDLAVGPQRVTGGAGVGQVGEEVADVPGERMRLPEL
jgi:hypothetical protein